MKPPPGPIEFERSPRSASELTAPGPSQRPTQTAIVTMPASPAQASAPAAPSTPPVPGVTVSGEDISMAIEQTPLPMFVQILYGNVLKKAYSVDPAVSARTDMVTFKTSQPIPRARMEQIAVNLLRSYGITVQDYDGLVRIVPDTAASAAPSPQLRRGKTMGETSEPLRPVFQHVELDTVRSTEVAQWLKQILGTRVNATEDAGRNGLLLSGTQNDIRSALELIQSLDQPRMRGRVARRVTPAFAAPAEFSVRLADVLTAQGYAVATAANQTSAPILIIPIQAIGSVIVFTVSDETMEHVLRWARELDRPPTGQTSNALFTYAVKYADAQDLSRTLGELLGGAASSAPTPAQPGATAQPQQRSSSGSNRVVVNSATNTLIFRGTSADEYQQIMTLLRELDRPTKSALIEVTVAELTVGTSLSLGIDWNLLASRTGAARSISGEFGSKGAQFSVVSEAGRLLTAIRALAQDNRARILSNPRVVARNGETATIQVGKEVPIVTSQQSTNSGGIFGGNGLITQVQYRSTGVILRVRPVINSGNRLDLEVSQEVSSAEPTDTGVSSSPTIGTKRVETKMSLRDGSTVILGGLISRNTTNGTTGVPFLKDVPLVGSLFRSQSITGEDIEMLVMITPYVINDDYEAEAITEAVQKSFGAWAQDIKPARSSRPLPGSVPIEAVPLPSPAASTSSPELPPPPAPTVIMPRSETPAAPGAARTPPPVNDGVTTSRPPPAPAPSAAPAPVPAPAGQPRPASPTPPVPGREVTDEKTREEIRKLFEKR